MLLVELIGELILQLGIDALDQLIDTLAVALLGSNQQVIEPNVKCGCCRWRDVGQRCTPSAGKVTSEVEQRIGACWWQGAMVENISHVGGPVLCAVDADRWPI